MNIKTIILAAGKGTRMKSKLPKVLHKVAGLPIAEHVIMLSNEISDKSSTIVIGHMSNEVNNKLKHLNVEFIIQEEQLGTGHAIMIARDSISRDDIVLILYGDTPLIKKETLIRFIEYHMENKNQLSVLSMNVPDPTGYGRIVREKGKLHKIVEHKDADKNIIKINEVNSGIYLIDGELLLKHIDEIKNKNKQKEFYLTDIVEIFSQQRYNIDAYCADDYTEMLGINDRIQLAEAEMVMRRRINRQLMINGVTLIDPETIYIEKNVTIGQDTIIYPGTFLRGDTKIGESCEIGPRTVIENSVIGSNVFVKESQILNSRVGSKTTIGPYAYLRPGNNVGQSVKIGDFVEIKNSNIGNGTKISHLTYVGDGDVGDNVNLGCGVVFVNYDGVNKYRTTVENNSFVGCNVNLISPVKIANNSYVAAGTTVTKDVPKDSLAIGRERQKNIEGWVKRRRELK